MRYSNGNKRKSHRKRKLIKSNKIENNQVPLEVKSKVADTSNDNIYKDISISSTYAWTRISPIANDVVQIKNKKLNSLRNLCAKELAKNINNVDESCFLHLPWSCWKTVWENVLKLNLDTFHVFSIFASRFYHHKDFRAHRLIDTKYTEIIPNLRGSSVNSVMIPNSTRHRIENFFSNISLLGMTKYIHSLSYEPYVILDLSRVIINSKDELYMIFNIRNLIALNISNNTLIDDQYLNHLFLSITKEDKLKKLTVLQINNCRGVTKNGLKSILTLSKMPNLESSLSYIESDIFLDRESFTEGYLNENERSEFRYIENTNWAVLDTNSLNSKVLVKSPLGLKLHLLYKNYSRMVIKQNNFSFGATTNSINYLHRNHQKLLLDLMIHPNPMVKNINEDYSTEIIDIWKRRMYRSSNLENKYCYVVDYRKLITFGNDNNTISINNSSSSNNPSYSTRQLHRENQTRRKKPRLIKKNAEKFFEL